MLSELKLLLYQFYDHAKTVTNSGSSVSQDSGRHAYYLSKVPTELHVCARNLDRGWAGDVRCTLFIGPYLPPPIQHLAM